MKWIKDIKNNLINTDHIEMICIDKHREYYSIEAYLANAEDSLSYRLAEFKEKNSAEVFILNLLDKME